MDQLNEILAMLELRREAYEKKESRESEVTRKLEAFGRIYKLKTALIIEAHKVGIPKMRIAHLMGFARTTVDRILERDRLEKEKNTVEKSVE